MEVMCLMLGEFVDDYTVTVVDVFAMPQHGTGVSVEAVDPVFQTKMLDIFFGRLDPHLSDNAFIAGAKISIADISCFFATNMATAFEMDLEGKFPNTYRWHQEFSARPSTEA